MVYATNAFVSLLSLKIYSSVAWTTAEHLLTTN